MTGPGIPAEYRAGLDPLVPGVALIESNNPGDSAAVASEQHFATVMPSIPAGEFRAKEIRLRASLRSEGAGAGTLWMRVDKSPGTSLRFDNMMNRENEGAIRGSVGWTDRQIVFDVLPDAPTIHFGFLLVGPGRVWARRFSLDPVGPESSPTSGSPPHPLKPINLDF